MINADEARSMTVKMISDCESKELENIEKCIQERIKKANLTLQKMEF